MITLSEIEAIEAHADSLKEVARKMRAKLEKQPKKRSGLSAAAQALIDQDLEKTFNRRKPKNQ